MKSDLLKKEDWLAVWIGFIVIAIACVAVLTGWFDFAAAKFSTWTLGENLTEAQAAKVKPLGAQLASGAFWIKILRTFLVLGILFTCGVKLQGGEIKKFVPAFVVLFILAVVVRLISAEFTEACVNFRQLVVALIAAGLIHKSLKLFFIGKSVISEVVKKDCHSVFKEVCHNNYLTSIKNI